MDLKLAARLARYSELAYARPEALRAALPEAEVTFLDRDHTQAYVIETATETAAETAAETVVAFRGTQVFADPSLADMLSNLWFRRRPWGPGRVHRGYREALLDIVQELKRPLYSGRRPLYFTGHSMGGALATLASTLAPGPSATYSFGAPRVGDGAFARSLANLVRIVHGTDIAPRYPLPLGYRHGGEVWHLSGAGVLTPGLPPGWQLRLPLTPATLARAVLDPRASEYARKLALAATPNR